MASAAAAPTRPLKDKTFQRLAGVAMQSVLDDAIKQCGPGTGDKYAKQLANAVGDKPILVTVGDGITFSVRLLKKHRTEDARQALATALKSEAQPVLDTATILAGRPHLVASYEGQVSAAVLVAEVYAKCNNARTGAATTALACQHVLRVQSRDSESPLRHLHIAHIVLLAPGSSNPDLTARAIDHIKSSMYGVPPNGISVGKVAVDHSKGLMDPRTKGMVMERRKEENKRRREAGNGEANNTWIQTNFMTHGIVTVMHRRPDGKWHSRTNTRRSFIRQLAFDRQEGWDRVAHLEVELDAARKDLRKEKATREDALEAARDETGELIDAQWADYQARKAQEVSDLTAKLKAKEELLETMTETLKAATTAVDDAAAQSVQFKQVQDMREKAYTTGIAKKQAQHDADLHDERREREQLAEEQDRQEALAAEQASLLKAAHQADLRELQQQLEDDAAQVSHKRDQREEEAARLRREQDAAAARARTEADLDDERREREEQDRQEALAAEQASRLKAAHQADLRELQQQLEDDAAQVSHERDQREEEAARLRREQDAAAARARTEADLDDERLWREEQDRQEALAAEQASLLKAAHQADLRELQQRLARDHRQQEEALAGELQEAHRTRLATLTAAHNMDINEHRRSLNSTRQARVSDQELSDHLQRRSADRQSVIVSRMHDLEAEVAQLTAMLAATDIERRIASQQTDEAQEQSRNFAGKMNRAKSTAAKLARTVGLPSNNEDSLREKLRRVGTHVTRREDEHRAALEKAESDAEKAVAAAANHVRELEDQALKDASTIGTLTNSLQFEQGVREDAEKAREQADVAAASLRNHAAADAARIATLEPAAAAQKLQIAHEEVRARLLRQLARQHEWKAEEEDNASLSSNSGNENVPAPAGNSSSSSSSNPAQRPAAQSTKRRRSQRSATVMQAQAVAAAAAQQPAARRRGVIELRRLASNQNLKLGKNPNKETCMKALADHFGSCVQCGKPVAECQGYHK